LAKALERARGLVQQPLETAERLAQLQAAFAGSPPGNRVQKVVGQLNDEYFLLSTEEVLAFQAEGEITWIITAKQRFMATHNLKSMEIRLQSSNFRRIHRNALVNVDQIRKLSMLTSQRWLVTLNNGQELIVSKRQAKYVREVLHG
jgi:DNA-binding LytR/AlgR family response regulator